MSYPAFPLADILDRGIGGGTVFMDVDGTLIPDKGRALPTALVTRLRTLASANTVYVCSHGDMRRSEELALRIGARVLRCRKPFSLVARRAAAGSGSAYVIGDRHLTDGLLARFIGAEFLMVQRVTDGTESVTMRLAYLLDPLIGAVAAAVDLLRPLHWIKNILIFAPLFFASAFTDAAKLTHVVIAFAVFCALSSAVYVFNDILDRDRDRVHPSKRFRPLASGRLTVREALAVLMMLGALIIAGIPSVPGLIAPVILYALMNVAYSVFLKHVAIADIVSVAVFYLIRLDAGGTAAAVPLSPWIILCTFFGALFLITGKRKSELRHDGRRSVLADYSEQAIDYFMVMSATLAVITYALYSVIGHPAARMVYSVLPVLFILFRILNRSFTHPDDAERPEVMLFRDPWVLGALAAWMFYVLYVFYVV